MENKEIKKTEEEKILMTEEEYQKKQRLKTKKTVYRVAMVAGVIGIFLLVLAGIFEPLFEMTYFGRIFTPEKFKMFWGTDGMGTDGLIRRTGIYSDWLQMGTWLPKTGITVIYLGVILAIVYFFTYVIVDIINVIKSLIKGVKDITVGLNENVKVTYEEEKDAVKISNKKKENKKEEKKIAEDEDPFAKYEQKEEKKVVAQKKPKQEKPKKEVVEKKEKRRREEEPDLSDEQLAAMLRGDAYEDTSAIDAVFNK